MFRSHLHTVALRPESRRQSWCSTCLLDSWQNVSSHYFPLLTLLPSVPRSSGTASAEAMSTAAAVRQTRQCELRVREEELHSISAILVNSVACRIEENALQKSCPSLKSYKSSHRPFSSGELENEA